MAAPRKVLLVEDEFTLYEQLSEFLEDQGFIVIRHKEEDRAVDNYEDAVALLHRFEPDFAILDIVIRGERDGLELGAYIREHFHIPIIILSAHDNYENLERAKSIAADNFIVKIDKPVNKKQLWASINMLLPRISEGIKKRREGKFLKVREVDLSLLEKKNRPEPTSPQDPVELETFIKWDDIKYITSYNKLSHNNVMLYTQRDSRGYLYRSALQDIETFLPYHFVRFNQSSIVNARFITHKGKSDTVYFLDTTRMDISDSYRNDALNKLRNLLL